MIERIDVGVMGATGTVGRRLVQLLEGHPWFRLVEVGASPASIGLRFGDALGGSTDPGDEALSAAVLHLALKGPEEKWRSPLVLSAVPSRVAGPVEEALARDGHVVVSNASSHRMDADVPLIVPELNPHHLDLLRLQRRRWRGALLTNPNCSAVGLAMGLAPLHVRFGVERVSVVTLQALSGAGRRGPSAGDMLDNVLPHIAGEEEKLAREPQKVLGEPDEDGIRPASFPVSAQVHRVNVQHGHLLAVSVKLTRPAGIDEVRECFDEFRGALIEEPLPSSPKWPLEVLDDEARPQPRVDRDRGGGMTVSVGRIRRCEVHDVKFSILVHNLVRGAAGAALLNAELCHARGATRRA